MSDDCFSRRALLRCTAAAAISSRSAIQLLGKTPCASPAAPVRTITRGPKHHWFGYYDKLQFDPTNRLVLSNQVDFEHRTPRANDVIRVGMVDISKGDRWIELGSSRAWCWQQGCMLQWRPGKSHDAIWNDRDKDRFVSRLLNVETREERTLPEPVYTLSPDGRFAMTADFARIQVMRPGYGYVGLPDPHGDTLAPKDSGVSRVDLDTGKAEMTLSLADVAAIPHRGERLDDKWHYFNHLLINPDSTRFIVLHRWRARDPKTHQPIGHMTTRMLTANIDGSDLYILDPSGYTSHFIWRDTQHVCMWTRPADKPWGFYLFKDRTREIKPIGSEAMTRNGHVSYIPATDNEWILNDTYPDKKRCQHVYLYHAPSGQRRPLGSFHSPEAYKGEWRCDTHPRSSRDGMMVCIDSPHTGQGRQLHLIDINRMIETNRG